MISKLESDVNWTISTISFNIDTGSPIINQEYTYISDTTTSGKSDNNKF